MRIDMEYTLEQKYELIKNKLLQSTEKNPLKLIKDIMHDDFINIHGPEHHFLDGGVFMTALHNNGLKMNLEENLDKLAKRAITMPRAMCGYWGMCGSVASIAAVLAIIDNTGPISADEHYSQHMEFTSNVIKIMSEIGGPRCCKRNAFISLSEGMKYAKKYYGISIELSNIKCEFSSINKQCIQKRCPFYQY